MQKGNFGFSLWLYPFIALWMVLVGPDLGCLLILGFVIAAERDEWTIKQCAHVVLFNIYWSFLTYILTLPGTILYGVPFIGPVLSIPFSIIETVVWVVVVVLIFIQGLGRLKNGHDLGLPGRKIINKAYDLVQGYAQQQGPLGFLQQSFPPQQPSMPPQQAPMQAAPPPPPPMQQPVAPPPMQQPGAPAGGTFCAKCGAPTGSSSFCANCGTPVS